MCARAGLDEAAVVQAAAALLDSHAGREITLSELAAHLGVRTPSLYNHIGGQEELRRKLALMGLRELGRRMNRAAVGRSGEEAIMAIASAYRLCAHEHPGLYNASLRAPAPDDTAHVVASEELMELLRAVLSSFHLTDRDTIHAVRALRSLVHGFVSLEMAGGFGLPVDVDESFRRLVAMFLQGLQAGGGVDEDLIRHRDQRPSSASASNRS